MKKGYYIIKIWGTFVWYNKILDAKGVFGGYLGCK